MSAPLRPAARTRTRTWPAPGSGSGCSATTTSPSRTVAARTRRRLLALEQSDRLDVRGLREHVDRADAAQLPAGLDELRGVGRERRRVAGDVDDPLGPGLDDAADDLLREPRARRVDDEHVRAPGALHELAHGKANVAGEELHVGQLVGAGVGDRVGHRLLDDLQPPHLARARRQREADRADAAVEVVHALPALEV